MTDIIVIAVLAVILGAAAAYIIRAKKSGQKCIGCPYSKECASKGCGCCCGLAGASGAAGLALCANTSNSSLIFSSFKLFLFPLTSYLDP